MKNWLKIVIISSLILNSFSLGFNASAQISIFNVEMKDMQNGQAILTWQTNQETRSEIYYGLDPNNFERKLSYPNYKKIHQANLYGLEDDKTYFYKIDLYNRSGEKVNLYTRSFSTYDMEDTRSPNFVDFYTVQVAGNAVALAWEADENVYSEIQYYKKNQPDDKKSTGINGFNKYNQAIIYNLETYSEYYIKINIRDQAGNKKSANLPVNVYNEFNQDIDLEIRDIQPITSNSQLIKSDSVTITFTSNLAARAYILYGTDPNRLWGTALADGDKMSLNHEITIENLEPDTTYYYNIYLDRSFYNKYESARGLSFKTKATVLGIKEDAEKSDNDYDGLSNSFEMAIGTNPNDPDTDNDGYRDGTEVINGYNPLGSGKWKSKIQFFYGQPRLDLKYEQDKASELKKIVDKKLPYIKISSTTWQMLVKAYTYGDYPVDAILMYIKLGGKTVHPDISWYTWKDSPTYKPYAKYIKN